MLVQSIAAQAQAQVIAINGKISRRTYNGDKPALHTVSAFAAETRIVLGRQKIDKKQNNLYPSVA